MTKYKAVDFFCSGGGMSYGMQQAGIKILAGIDFDKNCEETYRANINDAEFIHADVFDLKESALESKLSLKKNDDNLVLIGCSPCQFWSIINTTREKSKKSKDLLRIFSRFIAYYNPGYVIVENVPGLKSNGMSVLPEFLKFLDDKKYVVCEKVIDLSYYGVPQSRKRFSLIASRVDRNIKLPEPEENQSLLKDFIGVKNGFNKIPAGYKDDTEFIHTTAGLKSICIDRLAITPHDGGDRFSWKDNHHLQLKCFIGKDECFKDTYGRMFWNKPASTITTKFFSISNGRFAHPEEDRAISLREGATLQTFPKDYIFKTTSIAATAKLIGNAVPPEYARRLGLIINNSSNGTV